MRTALFVAGLLAVIAFVGARLADLDSGVTAAIIVALALGGSSAYVAYSLSQRVQVLEAQLRWQSGPLKGHLRLDHVEGELALARARLLLNAPPDESALERDMHHVIASGLLAGFEVEVNRMPESEGGGLRNFRIVPPTGMDLPGVLVVPILGGELKRRDVDTAANWLRGAGAPLYPVEPSASTPREPT